jgi:hypothetical protein
MVGELCTAAGKNVRFNFLEKKKRPGELPGLFVFR